MRYSQAKFKSLRINSTTLKLLYVFCLYCIIEFLLLLLLVGRKLWRLLRRAEGGLQEGRLAERRLNEVSHVHGHGLDRRVIVLLDIAHSAPVLLRQKVNSHTFTTETPTATNPAHQTKKVNTKLNRTKPTTICLGHDIVKISAAPTL